MLDSVMYIYLPFFTSAISRCPSVEAIVAHVEPLHLPLVELVVLGRVHLGGVIFCSGSCGHAQKSNETETAVHDKIQWGWRLCSCVMV